MISGYSNNKSIQKIKVDLKLKSRLQNGLKSVADVDNKSLNRDLSLKYIQTPAIASQKLLKEARKNSFLTANDETYKQINMKDGKFVGHLNEKERIRIRDEEKKGAMEQSHHQWMKQRGLTQTKTISSIK